MPFNQWHYLQSLMLHLINLKRSIYFSTVFKTYFAVGSDLNKTFILGHLRPNLLLIDRE